MENSSFKQLVILSGKGGTGKTTFALMLAEVFNNKAVIDCDVDAANLHLLIKHQIKEQHGFWGSKKASIDTGQCSQCGLCESLCRFDAISNFIVDPLKCEGCGLCYRACPEKAIVFQKAKSGNYFESVTEKNSPFTYARLNPGEGNSGKLVNEIKSVTIKNLPADTEWIIVDGPPGIGCPVNSSLSSADYVIIITEPTLSGMYDMKRLVKLLKTLNYPCGIVINKYDLNSNITDEFISYSNSENLGILGKIPYDKEFMKSLIRQENILNQNSDYLHLIKEISIKIKQNLSKENIEEIEIR